MSDLFGGTPVVLAPMLPLAPSPGQDARRIVRHGLAEVLAWLGEKVGPEPGDATHALLVGGTLFVSGAVYDTLRERT